MNSRSIGFVVVTLASFSSAARMEAPRTASMEFVGTTPCGETIRAFIGSMPAAAACHAVTLRIDLGAADGWTMAAKYGIPPASNPNQMINGPQVTTRGRLEQSGNTYRLISRDGKTISLRQVSPNLLHLLDERNELMVGTSGWSYTLSRADSADDKGGPEMGQGASRRLLPRATGSGVFGIFEGRTPCMGIARVLRVSLDDGCQKVKWRITLLQDAGTRQPTRYRIEGSLHRAPSGREGTWRMMRGTALDPGAVVLQLDGTGGEAPMLLWKADDDVIFLLDERKQPLVGTIDFGYTLHRSR